MLRIVSLTLLIAVTAACGGDDDMEQPMDTSADMDASADAPVFDQTEVEAARTVVPDFDALAVVLPGDSKPRPHALGDPATYPGLTRSALQGVNGVLMVMGATLGTVAARQPTAREAINGGVWFHWKFLLEIFDGEFDAALSVGANSKHYLLRIQRGGAADGYLLDGRVADSLDEWYPTLGGQTLANDGYLVWDLTWDDGLAHTGGTFTTLWGREVDGAATLDFVAGQLDDWETETDDPATDMLYLFGLFTEAATTLRVVDLYYARNVDANPAAEDLHIRLLFRLDGAGRATVTISGGDLGTDHIEVTECWDTDVEQVYATSQRKNAGGGNVGGASTVGVVGSCQVAADAVGGDVDSLDWRGATVRASLTALTTAGIDGVADEVETALE